MSLIQPVRRQGRVRRLAMITVPVVVAAFVAVVIYRSPSGPASASPPTLAGPPPPPSSTQLEPDVPSASPTTAGADHPRGVVGIDDGWLPDGVTVFDGTYPGVAHVDPALLGALRRAARDAAGRGLTLYVTSGWRSSTYQEQLLVQAVSTYGSQAEAARWVATPAASPHVSGHAVDLGHSDATTWLSTHGATYGLCQIYKNEPWHYELRPAATSHGCPTMYADPTHDPRVNP